MSGRGLRGSGVIVGAIALLAACSSGGHASPPDPADSVVLVTSDAPPVGSVEHPRPVTCEEGVRELEDTDSPAPGKDGAPGSPSARGPLPSESAQAVPARKDVTVGPLTWEWLGTLADGDPLDFGKQDSGGWLYSIHVRVQGDAVATVTVGAAQRASAGLEYGDAFDTTPTPAVTFHGCPGSNISFLGGFFVAGDGRACVPLDVRSGDGATRRVIISFFKGPCPTA